jgi:hypothetical protein
MLLKHNKRLSDNGRRAKLPHGITDRVVLQFHQTCRIAAIPTGCIPFTGVAVLIADTAYELYSASGMADEVQGERDV